MLSLSLKFCNLHLTSFGVRKVTCSPAGKSKFIYRRPCNWFQNGSNITSLLYLCLSALLVFITSAEVKNNFEALRASYQKDKKVVLVLSPFWNKVFCPERANLTLSLCHGVFAFCPLVLQHSWTLKRKFLFAQRLRQDRLRQEQLARERLAQLRSRRKAKEEETGDKLVTDGDVGVLQEAVMKALEHKHQDERQVGAS